MLSARIAHESDLSSIIDLYVNLIRTSTSKHEPHYPDFSYEGEFRTQLLNTFKDYINKKDKGIYLVCFKDTILGFSTFEPDPDIPDCLFISNFYFNFSKIIYIPELSEKDIEPIKTGMLLFLMNKATKKGYKKMSIYSDNHNDIHEICMSYNAKVENFYGMMYSYSEKLLFDNI